MLLDEAHVVSTPTNNNAFRTQVRSLPVCRFAFYPHDNVLCIFRLCQTSVGRLAARRATSRLIQPTLTDTFLKHLLILNDLKHGLEEFPVREKLHRTIMSATYTLTNVFLWKHLILWLVNRLSGSLVLAGNSHTMLYRLYFLAYQATCLHLSLRQGNGPHVFHFQFYTRGAMFSQYK